MTAKTIIGTEGWFIKKRTEYHVLTDEEYYKNFGIEKVNGIYQVKDKCKLESAYTKSWENRNFEIDKFWTRAAYFWGFIVLIFGGYIAIQTGEHVDKALRKHLDVFLMLLGLLFSIAWYLVILGSKAWQENWEAHIDKLEDYVSGPLYKTINYKGNRFFSVSKLNEILAVIIVFTWTGFIIQYLIDKISAIKPDSLLSLLFNHSSIAISFGISICFLVIMCFGYCLGEYKTEENKKGFFDRCS